MLYYLNHNDKQELEMLERTNLERIGWKEEDLEQLLAKNMDRLFDEESLMPIFTERKFQEEPDIMALDKTGKLYIFELKRWKSAPGNLLQVLRYGQIFGQYSYDQLNDLYHKFDKNADDLKKEHQEYFNLQPEEVVEKERFNHSQHFLIVTDGTDVKTREAINYWKKSGLDIDSIIYRVYITASNEALIEFNTYSPYQDVIEYEASSYILNTNFKRNREAHRDMLENGKAAAYYSPWKYKIKRIQKGDRVFLYKSGTGIVAVGNGTGIVNKTEYEGNEDAEFNMELEDFIVLKKPLSAAKMKEITNSNYVFYQTMFSLEKRKSDVIWKYINEHCV